MHFDGTAGDDLLTGTRHDDDFDLTQGGDDTASGKAGPDAFFFADTFTKRDFVDGGNGGSDTVVLSGDYSAGVTIGGHTMANIEILTLGAGFDYQFTFANSVVGSEDRMRIDGAALGPDDSLVVHAEDEWDASYAVLGGGGNDLLAAGVFGDDFLSGGNGNDVLKPGAGKDTVYGGLGDDIIQFVGTPFGWEDRFDGGDDFDTLILFGDYSRGLDLIPTMMINVEQLTLTAGVGYKFDLTGLSAPEGEDFTIDGSALAADDRLVVHAAQLPTYFGLVVNGGAADDFLAGGTGHDVLYGFEGADKLQGRGGVDEYGYDLAVESTGANYDTVVGFDPHHDFIRTAVPLAINDAVTRGGLSTTHFDANLEAVIGSDEMDALGAVLFTPSRGTLAGELFIIIDRGGGAGYQAGLDLVIHLDGAKHMDDFGIANFVAP